jgi:hypothetical protein
MRLKLMHLALAPSRIEVCDSRSGSRVTYVSFRKEPSPKGRGGRMESNETIVLAFRRCKTCLLPFGIVHKKLTAKGGAAGLSFSVTGILGESKLLRMPSKTEYDKALLHAHRLHAGVYRRVADQLGVDPSYVSRVATGERKEEKIRRALLDELHKIQRTLR